MLFTLTLTLSLLELMTFIISLLLIVVELIIIYYFNREKTKQNKTIATIILKILYILLGLLNNFVFWFISCFLFIYLWFLFLKIKFSNEYDGIFLINTLFLVICAFLAAVLLSQVPLHWIFTVFGIILFAMLWLVPYIINRRKVLNFRKKAKKSFQNESYNEVMQLLKYGVDSAGKMLPTHHGGYYDTDLKRILEKEIQTIQKGIENNNLTDVGKSAILFNKLLPTKKNKRNVILAFLFFSLLFFPLFSLIIFSNYIP